MKNSTILSICLIALTSIIGISCEKNSEEVKFIEVEYGILGIDEHVVTITYNDASGKPVVINDPSKFVNGSMKQSVSAKPFTASMEVQVSNPTLVTKTYTIAILVDGEPKAIKSVSCPPAWYTVEVVEFTIQ